MLEYPHRPAGAHIQCYRESNHDGSGGMARSKLTRKCSLGRRDNPLSWSRSWSQGLMDYLGSRRIQPKSAPPDRYAKVSFWHLRWPRNRVPSVEEQSRILQVVIETALHLILESDVPVYLRLRLELGNGYNRSSNGYEGRCWTRPCVGSLFLWNNVYTVIPRPAHAPPPRRRADGPGLPFRRCSRRCP